MTMYAESLRAFLKPIIGFLDDDAVTEVMVNGPDEVWIERAGKLERTTAKFTAEGLIGAVRNVAQSVGRPLSEEHPRLDARMPDGSRVHAVVAPLAKNHAIIAIRKFFREKIGIEGLINRKALTPAMSKLLEACVAGKLNILVAGGTSSGKTTLLNVVATFVPGHERILVLEDSSELQMNQPHVVSLEARPPDKFGKNAVSIGELLHSALRLRPDRIVVGEVRGGEAFHLVQAMNTGHGGSMSTTHANTPIDTLRRIESLCLLGVAELPLVAARAQVASAVELVVTCARMADGSRKVTAIAEVLPLTDKGDYRIQDIFVFRQIGRAVDGTVLGFHGPTGIVPNCAERLRAYGFHELTDAFFDPATYHLPPPPKSVVGQQVGTHWAPSLAHRERGEPDPEAIDEAWQHYVQQLTSPSDAPRVAPLPPPAITPAPMRAMFAPPNTRATPSPSAATRTSEGRAQDMRAHEIKANDLKLPETPHKVLEPAPAHLRPAMRPSSLPRTTAELRRPRKEDTDGSSFDRTVIRAPDADE